MVTGAIRDAALGLAVLKGGKVHAAANDIAARDALVGRYRMPQPRVAWPKSFAYASAAMDVSDGLAGDLAKLCGVSGVSAASTWLGPAVGGGEGSGIARHRRTGDVDRRRR